MSKVNVKKQTKRATKWLPDFADNINIIIRNSNHESTFELGIVTTKWWGDFKEDSPKITITTHGEGYTIPLADFETIILNHCKEFKDK